MSTFLVEVPAREGFVSNTEVAADHAEVEFGVLKFFGRDGRLVSAFMQWNHFTPEEII